MYTSLHSPLHVTFSTLHVTLYIHKWSSVTLQVTSPCHSMWLYDLYESMTSMTLWYAFLSLHVTLGPCHSMSMFVCPSICLSPSLHECMSACLINARMHVCTYVCMSLWVEAGCWLMGQSMDSIDRIEMPWCVTPQHDIDWLTTNYHSWNIFSCSIICIYKTYCWHLTYTFT